MDKMRTCNKCGEEKDIISFKKDRNICKICNSAYKKEYYSKNKQKVLSSRKEYSIANKNKIKEYQKKYRELNLSKLRDESNKRGKLWAKNNSAKVNARTQNRNAKKLKATVIWANDFFIKEAYHLAKIRTEITGIKWHVDHIVPLKSNMVCGLHCEQNLQVIPALENLSKNNRYWPNMPEEI